MVIEAFPPLELADEDGVLCAGGDLEVASLLLAYRSGIFPWPLNSNLLVWFAPPQRAVLFLDKFHIPRSLEKFKRQSDLVVRFNDATPEVIRACRQSKNRGKQRGTWITSSMVNAYIDLAAAGHCQSVGCFHEGRLVGGLYGVTIGSMFAGESMFYSEPNASKIALCSLVERLRDVGVSWIDCQVMTPLFESFGAELIERDLYMKLLSTAIMRPCFSLK